MAEASSDDLVEDQHDLEKGSKTGSNSHRMSHLGRKSSSRTRQKHSTKRLRRRYETFDNPLTSWYFGGRVMVGGDKPWSVMVTLVLLFGITGVWLGTSGVWYWRYGDQYGLARGAGIGIVIVFA
jgi:palmitoyltransferase ZDHHC9/14/18